MVALKTPLHAVRTIASGFLTNMFLFYLGSDCPILFSTTNKCRMLWSNIQRWLCCRSIRWKLYVCTSKIVRINHFLYFHIVSAMGSSAHFYVYYFLKCESALKVSSFFFVLYAYSGVMISVNYIILIFILTNHNKHKVWLTPV